MMARFGMHYGVNMKHLIDKNSTVVVITGDVGELGKTQKKEIAFMKEHGIQPVQMTLQDFKTRLPTSYLSEDCRLLERAKETKEALEKLESEKR